MVLLIAMYKQIKKVSWSIKWKNLLILAFLLNSFILHRIHSLRLWSLIGPFDLATYQGVNFFIGSFTNSISLGFQGASCPSSIKFLLLALLYLRQFSFLKYATLIRKISQICHGWVLKNINFLRQFF